MTIEELAKLKPGDKLMWNGEIVTFEAIRVCVVKIGSGTHFVPLENLQPIPGPTLPPHVAEIWEWDGEPLGFKQESGWVWLDGWYSPIHGTYHNDAYYRLIRKRCACKKESK